MADTSDPRQSTILYKILTFAEFASLPTSSPAPWSGTALDISDGFIHTSSATQLPLTLNRFFKDAQEVWILAIPRTESIERHLKFDQIKTGEYFGHLYEPIDIVSDVAVRRLAKRIDAETFDLGELEF